MLDIIDTDINIIFYKFFVGTDVIHALDTALTDNDILLQISFAVIGVMPYLQTAPFSSTIDYRNNCFLRDVVDCSAEPTVIILIAVTVKVAEGIWFLCYRP